MSDLLVKLNNDPDVTEDDVLRYLAERIHQAFVQDLETMPVELFWQPGDLQHYRDAVAWWPADAPIAHARPYLGVLCQGIAATPLAEPLSFMQALVAQAERCREWLEANGRNVVNPNETREERRKRKAREGQARWRARNSATPDPEAKAVLDEKQQLYQAYMAACATRKEVAKQQDALVAAAWEAYQRVKAGAG